MISWNWQYNFSFFFLGARNILSNMQTRPWSQWLSGDDALCWWIKEIAETELITWKKKLRSHFCANFVSMQQFTRFWWIINLLHGCFRVFHDVQKSTGEKIISSCDCNGRTQCTPVLLFFSPWKRHGFSDVFSWV